MISIPTIEASGLSKGFTPSCYALRDVSFRVKRGAFAVLTGPNGSGKTTLLKILAALLIPDEGKILINGAQMKPCDTSLMGTIGFCPDQERSFYWRLTGRQNLDFFASLYGLRALERTRKINELLEVFHIQYADRRFDGYSAGMKKTFLLVRCLLHSPSLLLLDEPTKGLDDDSARRAVAVLNEFRARDGATILMSTHTPQYTDCCADTFLSLKEGQLCTHHSSAV